MGEAGRRAVTFLLTTGCKEPPDRILLAAVAALGAGLVFLRQASYGPVMWVDAVSYVAMARSLLAGDGLVTLGGGPLVYQPPLYPAMLAAGGLSGLDPYAVAGPLNAVIFGLTVLVAGWWMRRHLRSRFLWLWGCLSIALAFPLADVASLALSDSVFILFVTLSLTQIDAYLDGRGRASLIWAAVFSALACMTRYLGASLVLAAVPMLLAARAALGERMKRVAVYTLIAAAPLGLWILRNYLVAGSATGERGWGIFSFGFIVEEALRIVASGRWLIGLTAPVLLALVMAAGYGFHRLWSRKRDAPGPPHFAWVPLRVCAGFALVYLALLVASMMSGGVHYGLSQRFLAPVYIPLLFAALLLMDGALRYARKQAPGEILPRLGGVSGIRGVRILAAVLMLGLSLQSLGLVVQHGREIPLWNAGLRQGYGEPRWSDSESVRRFREAALTGSALSNAHPATALHAGGPARHSALPCEPDSLRSALARAHDDGDVHVLYFSDWGYWSLCSRQEHEDIQRALSQEPSLELVAELADGKLYRLREHESREPRPAMFLSSSAPAVGKPFVAYLNQSYGRRVAGERWRWERGSDALGWTSLPGQSPTYAHVPTAADVGHRLRASVPYTDHLGSRLTAITKPSEPVQAQARASAYSSGSPAKRVTAIPRPSEPAQTGPSEADRIIASKYDVHLQGNRLVYENRSCTWGDERLTRFPLIVYSLAYEGGTPERDTLDFEWHVNFWKDDGTCMAERQLPSNDVFAIQTGQVDRDGNLLWEAEGWLERSRWRFDAYLSSLSSATSGEPAARGVFDIHLGEGSLVFVKAPCAAEDTESEFFLRVFPANVDDLPHNRRPDGFDNLDFAFRWHGLREGGRCVAVRALPEYDIVSVRAGQREGGAVLWSKEFPLP